MNRSGLIGFFERYQKWLKGDADIEQPDPELVDLAISYIIEYLKGNIK